MNCIHLLNTTSWRDIEFVPGNVPVIDFKEYSHILHDKIILEWKTVDHIGIEPAIFMFYFT